jgi:DNA-binding transcriptional ArsR family regulator/uncharacterized protein YndB with AHSA1/START domain
VNEVFGALNDPSRRALLDRLFEEDGRSLTELCDVLPDMTRFGVMNHLDVLESAGLITTRRDGRRKLHYLNSVPIRLVHDRWISKYTEPVVGAVAALKTGLEGGRPPMNTPEHVYQVYIKCTVDAAWNAIVDGDVTMQYYYGTRVESAFEPGAPIRYTYPDGTLAADGAIIACDPPTRLETTFHPRWDPDLDAAGPIRMVWLVEAAHGLTRVTVELWDIDPHGKTYGEFTAGIPYIVSGMKSLLETGEQMAVGS